MTLSSCRKVILAAAITAALGLSARAADPAVPTQPASTQPAATMPAASVVATVNGKAISLSEFDREVQNVQMQTSRQLPPEALAQLMPQMRLQAMTNLVNKQLLLQAIVDRKITVSDDELKKSLAEVMKNVPPGETLDEALKHAGIAKNDFMQQMTESLAIQKLLEQETKSVTATDADLTTYYAEHPDRFKRGESVSARHILIMFAPGDDDAKKAEKKKRMEAIRVRLVKGEDFAKVCTETSEDPGSKDNGGLYEDFPRGRMVPPFENAAFTQKIGEIGPIVETSFGYHIIKVEKHTEPSVVPLAEIKDRLKAYLDGQKKQEAAQKYVKSLRDAAKIVYTEGYAPPMPATAPAVGPTTAPTTAPSTPAK